MEKVLREKLTGGKFQDVASVDSRRNQAVRGKGNKTTEVRLRLMMVRARVSGWKMHPPGLPGKPDFIFPDRGIVVFVDGCYWHGCPKCSHAIKVNASYWETKIKKNQERDHKKALQLQELGYRVLRFWEHELAEEADKCIEVLQWFLSKA